MINKHFLKTLLVFTGMIFLGLLGIFLISYFDKMGGGDQEGTGVADTETEVAK